MRNHVLVLEAGKPPVMTERPFAAMGQRGMELTAAVTPPGEHS